MHGEHCVSMLLAQNLIRNVFYFLFQMSHTESWVNPVKKQSCLFGSMQHLIEMLRIAMTIMISRRTDIIGGATGVVVPRAGFTKMICLPGLANSASSLPIPGASPAKLLARIQGMTYVHIGFLHSISLRDFAAFPNFFSMATCLRAELLSLVYTCMADKSLHNSLHKLISTEDLSKCL